MILWSIAPVLFMIVLPTLPHLCPAVVAALPSGISPGTAERSDQTSAVYARKATRRVHSAVKNQTTGGTHAKGARAAALPDVDATALAEAEAEAEAAIAAALADEIEAGLADGVEPDASHRPHVKVMNFCHHCGAKLMSSRSVYCNTCGKPLAEVARS